jgi:hypothetical protein
MLKFSQNIRFKKKNYERKIHIFKKYSEIFYIKHENLQNKMIIWHWNVELCMVTSYYPFENGSGAAGGCGSERVYEESSS